MSTSDPRHYALILSPVITEKATIASDRNQVMFKVAKHATKPQVKAVRGRVGEQSEVKRAIVTLEEGHRIDVTTGL